MNSVSEKKRIISKFIGQCNDYADGQISKYHARLQQAADMETLELEAKIYNWKVYKAFNRYTIDELATGELDHWLNE